MYFYWRNSYPFIYLKAEKNNSIRVEAPEPLHHREYALPPGSNRLLTETKCNTTATTKKSLSKESKGLLMDHTNLRSC